MVISCVTVDVLPQLSVNVQVLVMMDGQVPTGAESVPATDPVPTQLSLYPREIIGGTSPIHWMVNAGGAGSNTGAIVSEIVISCVTVDVLPQESVNVHVLVMIAGQVPTGAESVPTTDPAPTQLST